MQGQQLLSQRRLHQNEVCSGQRRKRTSMAAIPLAENDEGATR
jgi:hypothetical protein